MNSMWILNLNKDDFNFQLHQKSYIEKLEDAWRQNQNKLSTCCIMNYYLLSHVKTFSHFFLFRLTSVLPYLV